MRLDLLGRNLWQDGEVWDMPSFLSAYTLHDSDLIDVRFAPLHGVLMIFQWDLYWNPGIDRDYNLLVVRLRLAYSMAWRQGEDEEPTVADGLSHVVEEDDRAQVVREMGLHPEVYRSKKGFVPPPLQVSALTKTVIKLLNGSSLEILHDAEATFACLNKAGDVRKVPRRPPRAE